MRPADAIPDAPVYAATMAEMENLEELLASANQLAMQYGAVRIDPPAEWTHPPLRMSPKSRFFVRIQTLPEAPFVDPEFLKQANQTKRNPRKRSRRKHSAAHDEDSDEPLLVTKDSSTATRDRAARAASRSQRNEHHQTNAYNPPAADHGVPVNFISGRTAPENSQALPPNSAFPHAMLPAPDMYAPGPKVNDQRPPLPFAPGQTYVAPVFSRAPAPRHQPSNSSPRKTEAEREAALRLAEAFSGLAKAGPDPNATAIPPCPFSQRTARKHIEKLAADDQSPFPLPDGLSFPQALPAAVNGHGKDLNRSQSLAPSGGESQERFMRQAETPYGYDLAGADRIAESCKERDSQVNCVQHISVPTLSSQEEANSDQRVRAAVFAWTEMLQSNSDILQTKNHATNGHASDMATQNRQVLPASSSAFAGNQPQELPVIGSGLQPTNSSFGRPIAPTPGEPYCARDYPEKNLQDAKRTVPFLSCPTKVPVSHESVQPGKTKDISTVNRKPEPPSTSTTWRSPARELESRRAAPSQSNTTVRPILRSVLPPARAPFECQRNLPKTESFLQSSAISAAASNHRIQGGGGVRSPEKAAAGPTSCPLPPARLFLPTNASPLANRSAPLRLDGATEPPQNVEEKYKSCERQWKPKHVHPCQQLDGGAKLKPLSCASTEGREKLQKIADKNQTVVNDSDLNRLSTDASACGKELKGLEQRNWELHHPKESCSTQNANWEHTSSKMGVPAFPNSDPYRDGAAMASSGNVEVGVVEQTKFSQAVPVSMPNGKEADYDRLFESGGLPRENLEIPFDPAQEIVQEILAVATRGADLISDEVPSKVLRSDIPPEGVMTSPGTEPPTLIFRKSRSRRDDTMAISNVLNNTVQGHAKPTGEEQKTLTDPDRATKRNPQADSAQPSNFSKAEAPHCSPICGAPQMQLHSSDLPEIVKLQDKSVCDNQGKNVSPVRRLAQPAAQLNEQQVSHPPQLKESEEVSEEVVLVAENRIAITRERQARKTLKPVPIINVDTTDAPVPESKDMSSCPKPPTKRRPKRKSEKLCPHFDQDDIGRLTKAIVFPDSGTPISLADYEKKAHAHHEETRRTLHPSTDEGPASSKAKDSVSKIDMRDVDTLEIEFWNAMSAGVGGKAVTVAYGVDVEAEGAFDSTEMSYVEWYGADSSGGKPNKRKRGRPSKQKGVKTARRSRANEHVLKQSMHPILGSCDDGLHHEADDEMEYGVDDAIRTPAARKRIDHVKKTKPSPAVGRGQSSKWKGPRSHVGTLNRDGVLRHLPRMPGINHSMYYVGQLFTRFCWHTEDAYLNSVSYLHRGSAEKVWYAVPPRDAPKFERYAASNVFSPEMLEDEGAGQALLMNKTTMFDPRRVRRKGVAVFRVKHKPGSFVLTAARAYHAGFNCGFNIAEAVNFANPTWFPVGREASCFARQKLKPLCVPWEYLLFHEAKAMRDLDHGTLGRMISMQRLIGNARIVAKELGAIIMNGEMKIRKYAEASNCRVSMLHRIDGLAKNNQVGPEFGHGAGMVCSLCAHTCHFYAEMCGSCDDSFEARCVDHFGKGHRMCSEPHHKTVIVRRHDPVLLLDILGCLEQMAGIMVDPLEQSNRYLGYLRPWQTPLRSSGLRLRLDLKAAASRLPPKVSKEKNVREKSVRERNVRGKGSRDKVGKIRKPRGMFPQAEVRSKRAFPKVKVLEEVEVIAAAGFQHEKGAEGEYKFDDVVELTSEIPLLR